MASTVKRRKKLTARARCHMTCGRAHSHIWYFLIVPPPPRAVECAAAWWCNIDEFPRVSVHGDTELILSLTSFPSLPNQWRIQEFLTGVRLCILPTCPLPSSLSILTASAWKLVSVKSHTSIGCVNLNDLNYLTEHKHLPGYTHKSFKNHTSKILFWRSPFYKAFICHNSAVDCPISAKFWVVKQFFTEFQWWARYRRSVLRTYFCFPNLMASSPV